MIGVESDRVCKWHCCEVCILKFRNWPRHHNYICIGIIVGNQMIMNLPSMIEYITEVVGVLVCISVYECWMFVFNVVGITSVVCEGVKAVEADCTELNV